METVENMLKTKRQQETSVNPMYISIYIYSQIYQLQSSHIHVKIGIQRSNDRKATLYKSANISCKKKRPKVNVPGAVFMKNLRHFESGIVSRHDVQREELRGHDRWSGSDVLCKSACTLFTTWNVDNISQLLPCSCKCYNVWVYIYRILLL